jgi:hypothetical protein
MTMKKYIPWLYLGLGFAQAAHSIEEILTGLWRWMPLVSGALHNWSGWTPVLVMPEQTFIIANMVIITLMLGFAPFVFLTHTWVWTIVTVVAVIETVNGVGHVSMALAHHINFPGCITGVALVLFSVPLWGRRWFFKEAFR